MSGKVPGKVKGIMTKLDLGLSTFSFTLPFLLWTFPFTLPGVF